MFGQFLAENISFEIVKSRIPREWKEIFGSNSKVIDWEVAYHPPPGGGDWVIEL